MDEKITQAAETPIAAADPAPEETSTEAPTEATEGIGSPAAETLASAETAEQSPEINSEASVETSEASSVEAESADTEASAAAESSSETDAPAANENITMADVLAASDEKLSRPPVHRGMIVKGTIIMLSQEGIVVDVGAKIEGTLPYNQLFEFDSNAEEAAKYFKAGDEIQVYIVRSDVPNNTIILSKKRADQERAWNLLQEIHEKGLPVEVEIVEKVRGGLVANLGVRAFLPASQIDVRRISDLSPYVGQRVKVKIIELNRKRNRVIVSRRAIVEEEVKGLKEETLKKLEPGFQTEATVVEITDFGVFADLGGVDGLIHRSELSHARFNHPKEVVKVGDKLKVEVLDMDLERERINLSAKKLMSDPWENALLNYQIGQRIEGSVTNITTFGAFVEIEAGLEGLIHVSEMSWTKRVRHPKEIVNEGDHVEAMILKIDSDNQRISLGLRQTQPDPWSSLPDRYPPGTEVSGPITGLTDFGVFMEIEEGIEGLVHISELAHEHIDNIEENFKKGDEISAVILNIDPVEQRASLSRKRLLPYTGPSMDDRDVPMGGGAPSNRGGGGGRKGRRGGRRGQGIDYDYSYAASDSGSKTTTKLGDVYADLFAQFGLAEAGEAATEETPEADAPRAEVTEVAETAPAEVVESPAAEAPAEETPEVEATPEKVAEPEEEVDPENAIDAAEAAALLTAAFREGKRPPKEEAAEASVAEAEASEAAEASATEENGTPDDQAPDELDGDKVV